MPVESAADLAGMFDPDEFGEAAQYVPRGGGAAVALSVLTMRPEDAFGVPEGPGRAAIATAVMLPAAALPARPERGDGITLAAGGFTVASVRQSEDGALFTLNLKRA